MPQWIEQSDADLIHACRDGKQAAWDELVRRYERLVFTVPRRQGLTAPEVEDVFQSVWLLLLQHLHTLEQPDRLSAWLVTTARRESWKRRRGAEWERVDTVEPDRLPAGQESDDATPEALVIRYEQQQAIRAALARLDPRCRRLLHLLYYEPSSPSYEQVASTLKLAVGSIGPIRARCLKALRRALQP